MELGKWDSNTLLGVAVWMKLKFQRDLIEREALAQRFEGGERMSWGENVPSRERNQGRLLGICPRFKVKLHWIESSYFCLSEM